MRVDALLRLIVAMFFASLPLLLALVRAARRRRAVAGTDQPPEEQRRSGVARGLRSIRDGVKRALEAPPERGDQDLRDPAPYPHRHRESFVPGAPRAAGRRQSKPKPTPTPTSYPEKPASTYRSQPRREDDSDQIRQRQRGGPRPLRRLDRLTELQRAVVYQELLGTPRGLQPGEW